MMPDEWAELRDVSRETSDRLRAYVELLTKWNKTINLIAPGTVPEIWSRHILDSAQVMKFVPASATDLLDIGSGGGLPGIVLAILGAEQRPDLRIELVEADQRKCAFLGVAVQTLGLSAKVTRSRIEDLKSRAAQIITARALARLDKLLDLAFPNLAADGICLFMKGLALNEEIEIARKHYRFDAECHPSITGSGGAILSLTKISHV